MVVQQGQIVWAKVPYNDDPEKGKHRPAVVLGSSPMSAGDDRVVLIAMITSFGDGGTPKLGDVELLDWSSLGLTKRSWVRARRLWGASPAAIKPPSGPIHRVDQITLGRIYQEINAML